MRRAAVLASFSLACALALSAGPAASRSQAQGADAAPRPISLAIVYDTSNLTTYSDNGRRSFGTKRAALFAALSDFVRQANPQNEYFIVRFDTAPQLILGGTTDKESTLKALSKLSSVEPSGATSLFDACLVAADQVARGRHDRRAIILMSDGLDTVSKYRLPDVTEALARSGVVLYAVNIGKPGMNYPTLDAYPQGDEVLSKIAAASGGARFRLGGGKERIEVFQTIAARLRDNPPGGPR